MHCHKSKSCRSNIRELKIIIQCCRSIIHGILLIKVFPAFQFCLYCIANQWKISNNYNKKQLPNVSFFVFEMIPKTVCRNQLKSILNSLKFMQVKKLIES